MSRRAVLYICAVSDAERPGGTIAPNALHELRHTGTVMDPTENIR